MRLFISDYGWARGVVRPSIAHGPLDAAPLVEATPGRVTFMFCSTELRWTFLELGRRGARGCCCRGHESGGAEALRPGIVRRAHWPDQVVYVAFFYAYRGAEDHARAGA